MEIMTIILIALVVLAVIFVKMAVVIIPQSETKIVERLGKYYGSRWWRRHWTPPAGPGSA